MHALVEEILHKRGLVGAKRDAFLNPSYDARHDPFKLPDMQAAVDRLVAARKKQEKITIYGDYDIDGLTATTVLLDAFESFGFANVDAFIPNRFIEGYGLTVEAIEKIAASGAQLIVTVDCGSLSTKEITRANELGVDVVVTDHHNVAAIQPPAAAVINPKRLLQEHPDAYEEYILVEDRKDLYPFLDLAGVGVAFKLVQALQTRLDGLDEGQEKWLLDLVALGTVCDVVTLRDENRANVYWGLKVMAKTQRPGLRALMTVARVEPRDVNARSLGFALGPRMNASGRLETAQFSLDMLRARDNEAALAAAQKLDDMNKARRTKQDQILHEAIAQAETLIDDPVLVVAGKGWNHGIVGIVAAKLLEKFAKPTFVLEDMGEEAKGSARSYGDFSAADAIRSADSIISKGGGHKLAAGVTMPGANVAKFRVRVNEFYREQGLRHEQQRELLLPRYDVLAELDNIDEELVTALTQLEPFGNGNPQPVVKSENLLVVYKREMGDSGQHVKLTLEARDLRLDMLAFSAPLHFFAAPGTRVHVWYEPNINEFRGRRTVEGRLLHLEVAD